MHAVTVERRRKQRAAEVNVVLKPSVRDLETERRSLLDESRLTEDELRERAESYRVTPDEVRLLRRLDEIDYLLGEDE